MCEDLVCDSDLAPLSSLKSTVLIAPLVFQVHQLPLNQVEVLLVPLQVHVCLQPLRV